jgi:protein-S-isoprenylcysteine O-methyltransferase Ste14
VTPPLATPSGTRIPPLGPRGEGWVVLQAVLLVIVGGTGWLAPGPLEGPAAALLPGVGLLLIGLGGIQAGAGLVGLRRGSALTALPHPRAEATLVTSGIYRIVRHPVYGGLVIAALGWTAARASPAALAAAVLLLVFFDLKRRREEAWLERRFAAYDAYRRTTRALIPWLY